MSIFEYKAINEENKTIAGLVEAPTEALAAGMLEEKGMKILSMAEKKSGLMGSKMSFSFGGVKAKDVVVFSRQFAVLIESNVALVQSLQLLIGQTKNPKLRSVVAEVAEAIDGGARLSDSLARYPKVFSGFYVNVVRSGESSGKLDEVLVYLADEMEKDFDMMSKIKGAMIYPAFVFCGLGGVGALMMIVVVPKLTDIMSETGGELPIATRILIAISHFMAGYWWLLLIMIGGAFVGLRLLFRFPATKKVMDLVLLKLPIFGKLFQKIYLVRFTRSLRTLLIGGVNISKGLAITADIVTNSVYRKIILQTKKEVEDGNSITSALEASPMVPSMVAQMMGIGEKTGKLDMILEAIGRFYGREIDNTVANLMTLMEPIIMVVLGVGVGVMVAAVIMPMYNLSSQIG